MTGAVARDDAPQVANARAGVRERFRRLYAIAAAAWLNVTLVFLALNAVALAVLVLRPADRSPTVPAYVMAAMERLFPELSPADIEQLLGESRQRMTYEPFTQFREEAFRGRFFNIDPAGFRWTSKPGPWPPDPRHLNVFVFGGSTVFNYHVPDDRTMASYLQELLAPLAGGRGVRVYNFGRGAYFSSQERVLFEQLVVGGTVPDVAVFVDGLNDFFMWHGRPVLTSVLEDLLARQGRPQPPFGDLLDAWPVARLRPLVRWGIGLRPPAAVGSAPRTAAPAHDDPSVSDGVIGRYLANVRVADAVARAAGVVPVFVWQPVPTYRCGPASLAYHGDFGQHEYSRYGYPRMAERVRGTPPGPNFVWCADIQEGEDQLLYVDQVHYAPSLSRRLAVCITDAIGSRGLLADSRAAR